MRLYLIIIKKYPSDVEPKQTQPSEIFRIHKNIQV